MTRQTNLNKKAREIAQTKFKDMLKAGACPELNYKSGDGFESYNMIEYSTVWARFIKVAQLKLVELGFEYGFWENKRNQNYLNAVSKSVEGIKEEELNPKLERFSTIWD